MVGSAGTEPVAGHVGLDDFLNSFENRRSAARSGHAVEQDPVVPQRSRNVARGPVVLLSGGWRGGPSPEA